MLDSDVVDGSFREEARTLFCLWWPCCVCGILTHSMILVNMIGAWAIDTGQLAAVTLGSSYFNVIYLFCWGAATPLDTFSSQAFGRGDLGECRIWLWRSIIVLGLATPLFCAAMTAARPVLAACDFDPAIAQLAADYLLRLIPGVPPFILVMLLQKYQQSLNIMLCSVLVLFAGNFACAAGTCWAVAGGSINDIAWALTASRVLMALLMGAVVFSPSQEKHAGAQAVNLYRVVEWEPLKQFAVLAVSGALMFGVESLGYELTVFVATLKGKVTLAAHSAILQFQYISYLTVPLGTTAAATIRVANHLGARQPKQAKDCARLCLALIVVLTILTAGTGTIALFRSAAAATAAGTLFTADPSALAIFYRLLPLAGCLAVVDGAQSVCAGVLRAMGWQRSVAVCSMFAWMGIAVPLGTFLCLGAGWGVLGLWLGIGSGRIAQCVILRAFAVIVADWEDESRLAAGPSEECERLSCS